MPKQYTPAQPPQSRACEQCGTTFMIWASALVRQGNRGRFCSRECRTLFATSRRTRICEVCQSSFLISRLAARKGQGRFCSPACRGIGIRGRTPSNCCPTYAECPICKQVFIAQPHRLRNATAVYCTKACADAALSIPLADRFWKYVNKTESCWLWTGRDVTKAGYGRIRLGGAHGGRIGVHRAAWGFAAGSPAPPDMQVGHTCDVTNCVRNDDAGIYIVNGVEYPRFGHLFLCPQIVNEADKVAKGRQARGAGNGRVLHPESYPEGAEWPQAKFTDDDIRAIRSVYANHEATQVELAQRYNVRQTTISAIVLRKTWKHLA